MSAAEPPRILARTVCAESERRLLDAGIEPLLARLFAARGIREAGALAPDLARLLPPLSMKGITDAARLLADAMAAGERLCIIADYDCDGATACAVLLRGLQMLGAQRGQIDFLVPDRLRHGYGLSPAIVELAARHPRLGQPDWLITVDNGMASIDAVQAARGLGMRVIVTDHHLPGAQLPAADAIVNPNQPGCGFGSRHLAGVGVAFYLLLAIRAELRTRGAQAPAAHAPLQRLLDLVAIGTVADLVPLDENNRRLVATGLARIRAGRMQPGVQALLQVAGRDARHAGSADFGFAIGPRINAAGRLADISLGIECLVSDDPARALEMAQALDAINRERRALEQSMRDEALASLDGLPAASVGQERCGVVLHQAQWHEGLVGLMAGRIKDRLHRPVVALAAAHADPTLLRGSGRSVPGIHLRDVLDWIDKKEPDLLLRFGGHAMAAGLTIRARDLQRFDACFDRAVQAFAEPEHFAPVLLTDGPLDPARIDAALAVELDAQVWGQGFPAPLFHDDFTVHAQRIVGTRHLRVELQGAQGRRLEAIAFGRTEALPARARIAYRITRNEYRGIISAQLVIEAVEPLGQEHPQQAA